MGKNKLQLEKARTANISDRCTTPSKTQKHIF